MQYHIKLPGAHFFLSLACAKELLSSRKLITLLSNSPIDNEKIQRVSNSIPGQLYPHLSLPAFLVNLTDPNKNSSVVESLFKSLD